MTDNEQGHMNAADNTKASAAMKDDSDTGQQLYDSLCLPCHAQGPGHAGTMRLAQKLGEDRAVLRQRDDLQVDYIKTVVRQGIMLMPPFRPSEISDSQLNTLAAYLVSDLKTD